MEDLQAAVASRWAETQYLEKARNNLWCLSPALKFRFEQQHLELVNCWCYGFYYELGFIYKGHSDSIFSWQIATNLVYNECTKHFEVDVHFGGEKIESIDIQVKHIHRDEQLMIDRFPS